MPCTYLPSDGLECQYCNLVFGQARERAICLVEKLNGYSAMCYTQADAHIESVRCLYADNPVRLDQAVTKLNNLYVSNKQLNANINEGRCCRNHPLCVRHYQGTCGS